MQDKILKALQSSQKLMPAEELSRRLCTARDIIESKHLSALDVARPYWENSPWELRRRLDMGTGVPHLEELAAIDLRPGSKNRLVETSFEPAIVNPKLRGPAGAALLKRKEHDTPPPNAIWSGFGTFSPPFDIVSWDRYHPRNVVEGDSPAGRPEM